MREVESLVRQNWRITSGATLVVEWSRAAKSALVAATRIPLGWGVLPVPEYAIARRPAMLAVLGRSGEALFALDEELATMGARSDAAAEHYRSFGSALWKYVEA